MESKAQKLVNMDMDTLLRMLNKAYADEWLAFLQYWTAAHTVKGMLRREVVKELMEHAMEEFEHARKLAERIEQLGGNVLLTPEELIREANCAYVSPTKACSGKIVDQTIASERCAIAVYRRMLEETHGRDMVTYHLALELLKEELDHEAEFLQIREDLDSIKTAMQDQCCPK